MRVLRSAIWEQQAMNMPTAAAGRRGLQAGVPQAEKVQTSLSLEHWRCTREALRACIDPCYNTTMLMLLDNPKQRVCLTQALPEVYVSQPMKQPQHIICVVAVIKDGPALRRDHLCNKAYKQI